MTNNKKCPECGAKIVGRSDKKYCTVKCKNTCLNRTKRQNKKDVEQINKILISNRDILAALNPFGKTIVNKPELIKAGYKFKYLTQLYQTNNNNIYYLCYDYGIRKLDENRYLIIKKQPYMQK